MWPDWALHSEELCTTDQRFTCLFADKNAAASCLAASPTDLLPLDLCTPLCYLISANVQSLKLPVQTLLQFLHELTSGRAKATTDRIYSATQAPKQKRRIAVSPNSPVIVSGDKPAGALPSQLAATSSGQCGHHVALLRSMTLLFKLVSLLDQVTAKDTNRIEEMKKELSWTLDRLAGHLSSHMEGCKCEAVCVQSERDPCIESEEEQRLSVALVHFILPVMRRAVSRKAPELYQATCLRLLGYLLQQKLPHVAQAVAAELVKPGSLALLLAALDSSASISVLEVLRKLVLSDWQPAQQRSATALLLFQMQGATRCSALLCPWVTRAEVLDLPGHADGTEHLAGFTVLFPEFVVTPRLLLTCNTVKQLGDATNASHLAHLADAVDLLDSLLSAANLEVEQAVSERPSATAPPASTHASSACHLRMKVHMADGHVDAWIDATSCNWTQSAIGTQDAQPACAMGMSGWPHLHWPTPSAAEWASIDLMLGRTMYLYKLLRLRKGARQLPASRLPMIGALLKIACKLLTGHVSNPELDMKHVFQLAFPVFLRELADQSPEESMSNGVCHLATLLLRRLTLDPDLMQSGDMQDLCRDYREPEDSMALWTVFTRLGTVSSPLSVRTNLTSAAAGELMYLMTDCTRHSRYWVLKDTSATTPIRTFARGSLTRQYRSIPAGGRWLAWPHPQVCHGVQDTWSEAVSLSLTRMLWLYCHCPQVYQQCEAESLAAVFQVHQKLLHRPVQNAFLQERMLQACLTLMLNLFDCPQLQLEDRLKGIAECACLTVLHLLSLMAPPAPRQQSPVRLGLPSSSQDSLRDLFLSVLVSACERTSSWQSFREHALEFWVKRWRQDVSASVDHLCSQEWQKEGFNIEEAAVELPTGTTTNYVKMMTCAFTDVDASCTGLAEHASYALHWSLALLVVKLLQLECLGGCHEVAARQAAATPQPLQSRSKKQATQTVSDAGALPHQASQEVVRQQQELLRRSCEDLETVVACIDELGKHRSWGPVLAEARGGAWCCNDITNPTSINIASFLLQPLKRVAEHTLSLEMRARVEHMLMGSDVLGQEAREHALASAEQARAEQAEESQAAAKAAAKKAKKQRQKANKQLQAQAALPAAPATPAASQLQSDPAQHGMLAATPDGAAAAAAAAAASVSSPTSSAEIGLQGNEGADVQAGSAVLVRPATLQQGEDAGTNALTDAMADMQVDSMTAAPLDARTSPALSLFNCPLTKVVLQDPVILADGHTYERNAVEEWLQLRDTSPVTGAVLPHKRMLPNVLIKQALACQQQQQQPC
ncbi:hypothetical protein ABBQ32_003989 [Trebouxia sp. C0010 RCD-2024]